MCVCFSFDDTILRSDRVFSGKLYPKDRALEQQRALIALLATTALFLYFHHQHTPSAFFLCPPTIHSSLLFNVLSHDNGGKRVDLTWNPFIFFSITHVHLIYSVMCPFLPHLPLSDPALNAGGHIFILNSFSSSLDGTKEIKSDLFITI